jgi:hypothetical protein
MRPSHKAKEHEDTMGKRSKEGAPKSERLTSKSSKKSSKKKSKKGAKKRSKNGEDEGFNFKKCDSFSSDW